MSLLLILCYKSKKKKTPSLNRRGRMSEATDDSGQEGLAEHREEEQGATGESEMEVW